MDRIPTADDSRLADLVSLWQRRRADGVDVSAAELCRGCPQLLPQLQHRLAALQQLEGLADTALPPPVPPDGTLPLASPGQAGPSAAVTVPAMRC